MIYDNKNDNKGSLVKRRVQAGPGGSTRVQMGHIPVLANVAEEPFVHTGDVPNSKYTSMGLMSAQKFPLWSPIAFQPAPERPSRSTFCQSNRNQDGTVATDRTSSLV